MHDATEDDPSDRPADAARRLGDAATDATFGHTDPADERTRMAAPSLGLLMGEVGPKARAGSALRELQRDTRQRRELTPRGSSVPGMGRLLLVAVLSVVVVVGAIVFLLVWATS